ncbi:hypothetical protein GL2_41820 [Microbulbifer sp. GL-2]|nr:hypothetical protein GL2_41820 [Microbulbifer sp. GL-2]
MQRDFEFLKGFPIWKMATIIIPIIMGARPPPIPTAILPVFRNWPRKDAVKASVTASQANIVRVAPAFAE